LRQSENWETENAERITKAAAINAKLLVKASEQIQKERVKDNVLKVVRSIGRIENWNDKSPDTTYYIYAFGVRTTGYGEKVYLTYSLESTLTAETKLANVWASANVCKFLLAGVERGYYQQIDTIIRSYGTFESKPIQTILFRGLAKAHTGNYYPLIDIIEKRTNSREADKTQAAKVPELKPLPTTIKVKDCVKMEDEFQPNDAVNVIGYREVGKSLILRIHKQESKPDTAKDYVVSYWLKQLVEERKLLETRLVFKVLVGPIKTTPQKTKAFTVFV
jgi:hypothetical protein